MGAMGKLSSGDERWVRTTEREQRETLYLSLRRGAKAKAVGKPCHNCDKECLRTGCMSAMHTHGAHIAQPPGACPNYTPSAR